ncbi:MAG: hypothetical protein AB1649_18300 [Chloroflexota bacterium]
MDKMKALQRLLDGSASAEEIDLLKQLLASGEIFIGGNVNHSVIIIGSGNNVELTPEALDRLDARPLLGDLDRDPTGNEITSGLDRLELELPVRAPVLLGPFQEQVRRLRPYIHTAIQSLSDYARSEYLDATARLNGLCMEVLDISFNALCIGGQPPIYDPRSPFRGLESFGREDSEFFFGREELTRRLVGKIRSHPFLAVLGASGSGKSSLVMAGLIPALGLDYAVFRPGTIPLGALTSAQGKPLIIVDQFEELFTLIRDETLRKDFIASLLQTTGRSRVVITLRSDFLDEVARYHVLNDEVQNHLENVPPMDMDELHRAMEAQAKRVGLRFEADLSQQILDEVKGEPGAMPLLQHALWELWNRRHGCWLRASEYRTFGGVKQAITSTAEDVYGECAEAEREQVRDIFLRLTRLDDSDQGRDTRRRVAMEDIIPSGKQDDSTALLLDKLANARLIVKTVNENRSEIEVAHEALIRYWSRLRTWLNEDRDRLRLRESVSEDAKEWQRNGRDDAFLNHRGGRLDDALLLGESSRYALNANEKAYLGACVALRNREQQQRDRRRRALLVGLAIVTVVFALLGSFGWYQAKLADQEAQKARQQELSALALANIVNERSDLALLTAIQVYRRRLELDHPSGTSEQRALLTVAQETNQIERFLWDTGGRNIRAALYLDEHTIIYGNDGGEVVFFDLESEKPIGDPLRYDGAIRGFALSPDGQKLAVSICWFITSSSTEPCRGEIKFWDVRNKSEIPGPTGQLDISSPIVFAPDGRTLVFGDGNTLQTWDVASQKLRDARPAAGTIRSLAFNPKGDLLALGLSNGRIQVLETETDGREVDIASSGITYALAFHPDGGILAAGTSDYRVILWNTQTWEILATIQGHPNPVLDIAFSPDGKTMASASFGMIRLFDFEQGQPREREVLKGYGYGVSDITFSPDGESLVSASKNSVLIWHTEAFPFFQIISSDKQVIYDHSGTDQPNIRAVAFSEHDGFLLSVDNAAEMVYRYLDGHPPMSRSLDAQRSVDAPVFALNDDATLLAFALVQEDTGNCAIRIWSPSENEDLGELSCQGKPSAMAISMDGRLLALGTEDGVVTLWDISDGGIVHTLTGHPGRVYGMDFDREAGLLASSGCAQEDFNNCRSGEIILWDVRTGSEQARLLGHSNLVRTVAFSPDGTRLASGGRDDMILLWDVRSQSQIGAPLVGHASYVNALAFTSDGSLLASASSDLHIILWDVPLQQRIGNALVGHTSAIGALTFSHDGTLLASGDNHGNLFLWAVSPDLLAERLCARIGRNFTREEWRQNFPDGEYRATCLQWPLDSP